MRSIPEGLLEAARKALGYREKNNGSTKFGRWYYTNVDTSTPSFKTAPWCDMFVTWAAHQAGIQDYVGEFAYTVDHAKWFRRHDAWSDKPEPGALVFYDWSGSKNINGIDHVGIVERVNGRKIKTIEANVDGVWLKRKVRDQSKVVGYGLPRKVWKAKDGQRKVWEVKNAPQEIREMENDLQEIQDTDNTPQETWEVENAPQEAQEARDGDQAVAGLPKPNDPAKPQAMAAGSDAAPTVRAFASTSGALSGSDFGDLPVMQETTVSAVAVTALLCVVFLVRWTRGRTSSAGPATGRHRQAAFGLPA
ncbi:CHAP domain-containing protein [Streptosporangium sp. NPDC000396]|uniref:CHAP domain-containing protein n=1 Tax=Streptosporangium sp. NPDC000396 TaxID=3366185 RepID=UPI0036BA380A